VCMNTNEIYIDELKSLEEPSSATGSRPEYLTNKEAADYLRCAPLTLWRYRRAGKLPYSRIGSKLLYKRSDLDALVAIGSGTFSRTAR